MDIFIIAEQDLIIHVLNSIFALVNPITFQLVVFLLLSFIPMFVKLWIVFLCNRQNEVLVLLVVLQQILVLVDFIFDRSDLGFELFKFILPILFVF